MRVLIHAQHLSGVGHHVRALELARGLAAAHDVVLVDGGRPVPHASSGERLERLRLPRLARGAGGLAPVDDGRALGEVLAERRDRLRSAAARFVPDVLVVEHYPFSKWELAPEIVAAIDAVRRANPAARVVCSLRDVCPRTRHEHVGDEAYAAHVLAQLRERFDALVVHGDPAFTRLEAHFPAAGRIEIPVCYSGFVSEKPAEDAAPAPEGGTVVLSVGGGAGSAELVLRCIEAWRHLEATGQGGGRTLVIFPGLFWSAGELARVRAAARHGPFLLRSFGDDFLAWLAVADLSISRAGYNTCTNLLETRCPAVLLPDPRMSDQGYRAARFEELGLAEALAPGVCTAEEIAEAVVRGLERPRPGPHGLDLEGARGTRRALESLLADGCGGVRTGARESRLGADLRELLRAEGVRLTAYQEVTTQPSVARRRGAFVLECEDGTRLKARRLESAARARRVAELLGRIGGGYAPLLARHGDSLLLEWVEGPLLADLDEVPARVLRRCGALLGALHRGHADASGFGALPGVRDSAEKLVRNLDRLQRAGHMPPALARRTLDTAFANRPREASAGIIHKDFCAENIVLADGDSPVCIDNANLALGPHDLDLARTWYRWPMGPLALSHFNAGYEEQRSRAPFLEHFVFWATCVLVGAAATRLRSCLPGVGEPLARLGELHARDAADASRPLRAS